MKRKGRWKAMNEYGGWDNCETPTQIWSGFISYENMAAHIIAQREQIEALQKRVTGLDSFITEHASAIQRDQTDEETLAAAEDFRSDWFGGGWGASTRDQLAAYRATEEQDNE